MPDKRYGRNCIVKNLITSECCFFFLRRLFGQCRSKSHSPHCIRIFISISLALNTGTVQSVCVSFLFIRFRKSVFMFHPDSSSKAITIMQIKSRKSVSAVFNIIFYFSFSNTCPFCVCVCALYCMHIINTVIFIDFVVEK